jgi:hypothetical protein
VPDLEKRSESQAKSRIAYGQSQNNADSIALFFHIIPCVSYGNNESAIETIPLVIYLT